MIRLNPPNRYMKISRELFDQQRRPRFGTANPERMRLDFWEWMIRGDDAPPAEPDDSLNSSGWMMRMGCLKSRYGPWRARDLFNIPVNREDGPIWTFDRMGATETELPDGRLIRIGGEHEDYYDPDFCIYNDVVVIGPTDQIEIYGYPKEVFPPTDFHTATFTGDHIIIIGCLGYMDDRRPGYTPVYSLDLSEYRFTKIETSGKMPGWIFKHEASFDLERTITIRGGKTNEEQDGEIRFRHNVEEYALDIRSGTWRRLTDRNWPQFSIKPEDGDRFAPERYPKVEDLWPRNIEHAVIACDDRRQSRIVVEGVTVSITISPRNIEVIAEGKLPDDLVLRVAEEIRANAEAAIQHRCILEPV